MKRLSVEEFTARMAQLREAFDAPPMTADELARFQAESAQRCDDLWARITNPAIRTADLFARIQSDNRPN